MVIRENVTINGREFIRTYSDENRYVVRDGVSYSEAVDPADIEREYTEGDVMPEEATPGISAEVKEKAEAYDILMGGAE